MSLERILIVDDEPGIRQAVKLALEGAQFTVTEASSLTQMWQIFRQPDPIDLLILDLNLPDGDGLQACQKVRLSHDVGIIMLTGRTDAIDRIIGLEAGADDYMPKPFELRELIARVRSVLRRVKNNGPTHIQVKFYFDGWVFNPSDWTLIHDTLGDVALTQFEAILLEKLLDGHGRAQSRDELTGALVGRHHQPLDRSVDNLVSRVRKKLSMNEDSKNRIKAIRGIGYQFFGSLDRREE